MIIGIMGSRAFTDATAIWRFIGTLDPHDTIVTDAVCKGACQFAREAATGTGRALMQFRVCFRGVDMGKRWEIAEAYRNRSLDMIDKCDVVHIFHVGHLCGGSKTKFEIATLVGKEVYLHREGDMFA